MNILSSVAAVNATAPGNEFLCGFPSAGCANGMFNQFTCSCECIPPFCPDADGNCIVSGTCDDPWKDCERGDDCPWWPNPLKAESCTTGPKVPVGTWDLFNSEEICCKSNFPYSEYCVTTPESSSPTKYPTIALLEDDDEEIISIQFSVAGITDKNISMNSIKSEMEIVLRRMIMQLAERVDGLKVTKLEAVDANSLRRRHRRERVLKSVTFYFNIYVVRDDEKQFGPYIINEIRDSYDAMLTQIQSYSDIKYLRGNRTINFCALGAGEYDLCAIEEKITEVPSPTSAPAAAKSSAVIQPDSENGGLAGWAVGLISVSSLFLLCCSGYAIAVVYFGVANYFRDHEDKEDIQKNLSVDRRLGRADSSKRLAIMDSKSQRSRKQITSQRATFSRSRNSILPPSQGNEISPGVRQGGIQVVVCSNPQYPSFDNDTFTINTYSTKRRLPRDPTVFIPGRDGKPDPGTTTYSQGHADDGRSRKNYSEKSSSKPEREPTMYVDGKAFPVDPMLRQKRDEILYDEWQLSAIVEDVHSMQRGSTRYEIEAIDQDVQNVQSYIEPIFLQNLDTYKCDEPPSLFGSTNYQNRTSELTSTNRKSAFSKYPHRPIASRNATPISGVFSG